MTLETSKEPAWEEIGSSVTTPTTNTTRKEVFVDNADTEVSAIEIVSELDEGSANSGDGVSTQKALMYGKTYQFKVSQYTNEAPQDPKTIKWKLKYTSPANSKNKEIEIPLKETGESVSILFNDKDRCGCDVTITAYIHDPKAGGTLTKFHHNRFRWFDAKAIDKQIDTRIASPWRINQGRTSLCGMAALYYAMVKTNANEYKKLTKELLRTGEYRTPYGYTVKPNSSVAEKMYATKPDSQEFKNQSIPEVDWLVMATSRSGESNLGYDGIETGSSDQLKAVNWPGILERMVTKVAGFASMKSEETGVGSMIATKWFGGSSMGNLQEIDKLYQSGHQVLMMIDYHLISDHPSYNILDLTTDSHWVVYEGNLRFKDSTGQETTDLDKVDRVFFDVYTWGVNPDDATEHSKLTNSVPYTTDKKSTSPSLIKFKNNGISLKSWEKNYYGYISAQ